MFGKSALGTISYVQYSSLTLRLHSLHSVPVSDVSAPSIGLYGPEAALPNLAELLAALSGLRMSSSVVGPAFDLRVGADRPLDRVMPTDSSLADSLLDIALSVSFSLGSFFSSTFDISDFLA